MNGLAAEIALKDATYAFDKLYTYAIPPEQQKRVKAGCRVLVPFGRGNIKKQGIVFRLKETEIRSLKKTLSVMDEQPVLSEELLRLCEYMKESLFCTYYDAVSAMLPAGLSFKLVNYYSANSEFTAFSLLSETEKEIFSFLEKGGEADEEKLKKQFGVSAELLCSLCDREALVKSSDAKRKMGDATQKWVKLTEEEPLALKLTPRQREVTELVREVGSAAVKEICYFTGVSASVIDGLIKKGVLTPFEKQVLRIPRFANKACEDRNDTLTDEQQAAFDGMLRLYEAPEGETALLYGITGSGKTRVFMKLADYVTGRGEGVIVMVPEIALTPQLISIFTARYGDKVAVFHSAMSMGRRMDEWKRVRDGKALIAIGTRSAVFAPFKSLGLIVIDEEQEHTYKSEKSPRFRTADLAKFRTAYHKGLLCLASATPSVESYTNAVNGRYSLFKLKSRYGNAILPEVETVDMREEIHSGNKGVISNRLYDALTATLDDKKQAILLLNRRGHNTFVSCPKCGYTAVCPNCSVSLTYHSANNRLMCHYCGYSVKSVKVCPECGDGHMRFSGLGTQKAEEELKTLFPEARVLRLDADSTVARDSYATYLSDFAAGKYDILLGTQMVAKGLDFPNVTLVGVLGADSAMYSEDFRSFERTFSLLTQVVGRAGRGENRGRAIVQSVNPDSNLIELAKNQDYESFYEQEIATRRLMIYPPYCDICVVAAQSESREGAQSAVNAVFNEIKKNLNGEFSAVKLIILGPAPAAVVKVNNRYRYRMIIKCKNNTEFRRLLKKSLDIKASGEAVLSVDINPETII